MEFCLPEAPQPHRTPRLVGQVMHNKFTGELPHKALFLRDTGGRRTHIRSKIAFIINILSES